MEKLQFLPLIGVGKVRFGMSCAEVEKILGKPSEVTKDERYGDEPDELMTTLDFEDLGISLSFDKIANYRLTDIMTFGECAIPLEGGICIGMKKEDVFTAASNADLGPIEQDFDVEEEAYDEENDEGLEAFDLIEVGVKLWFKNDELDTIQLSPEVDDDDNFIWPKD